MEVSDYLHAPVTFHPMNEPLNPLKRRRLGGPQSLSGRCGKENNSSLSGIEP
jgi:hypothetical protein